MSSPFSVHRVDVESVWSEVLVLNRVARRLTVRANWLYLVWQFSSEVVDISLRQWHRALARAHRNLSFVDHEYSAAEDELNRRQEGGPFA